MFEDPDASDSDTDSNSGDEPPKRAMTSNKVPTGRKAAHQNAAVDPADARFACGSSADDRTGANSRSRVMRSLTLQ